MLKRSQIYALKEWKISPLRKPLILQGMRQVGKTSLLKAFGEAEFAKLHYFNFEQDPSLKLIFEEDISPNKIVQSLSRKTNQQITAGSDLIVFDEIQNAPRALTSLKYFCEDMPQQHVIAAGSLLGVLLAGLTEEKFSFPVGKVEFANLYPLSFEEFLQASPNRLLYEAFVELKPGVAVAESLHQLLWDQWKLFLFLGGMPEPVAHYYQLLNSGDSELARIIAVRQIHDYLIRGYEADIAKHSGKINALQIVRVLQAVPHKLARAQDDSSQKFTFKDVVPGIKSYTRLVGAIDWLESCGLVLKLKIAKTAQVPISAFCKENNFKLYLSDVGLLGALAGIAPQTYLDFNFGSYKGYIAENFVYQELVTAKNAPLASWSARTSEIEFVIDLNGELAPLEVKSGNQTKAKSLSVYIEKFKPKVVVKLTSRTGRSYQTAGTQVIEVPLYLAAKVAKHHVA